MNPLVIFLIGGSGARFLRSILYQLASGLQLSGISEIKLVIIDTDVSNGNYDVALKLLNQYQSIRNNIDFESANFRDKDKSKLFFHKVSLFDDKYEFITPLDAKKRTLGSLIDYTNLNLDQKDFVNLMLSEQELDEDLSIGFQGRPNMGTIGLEAIRPIIEKSDKLSHLLGDTVNLEADGLTNARFFTVSSMFGGMGASGMPMLVNKFNKGQYDKIPVGSLCYMHYFKINNGKGNNDSKYFPQRTYLAFEHYKNDFRNKLNSLYCIGKSFENETGVAFAPGNQKQINQAHYIEYLSATSIVHFCDNIPNPVHPRTLDSYALHVQEVENNLYANCAGKPFDILFEKYIRLVFIAKYFIERFTKYFDSDEMSSINWVKSSGFSEFSTDDKKLLNEFFKGLLDYDSIELYNYSRLRILKSDVFPSNISDVLPHKKYHPHKPSLLANKLKYNSWADFDMKGISDTGIESRSHIPRLLSIFDKSFTSIYNNIFR